MYYFLMARAFSSEAAIAAAAAGGEEFELVIAQFNVLLTGKHHNLIHVFTVLKLFLLFIAQPGEDPFQ